MWSAVSSGRWVVKAVRYLDRVTNEIHASPVSQHLLVPDLGPVAVSPDIGLNFLPHGPSTPPLLSGRRHDAQL
jgi:hypothetical protein